MTTSPPAPPPRPRQPSRLHLPGDARRRLHVTSAVVGWLLIAVLSGCSNDANGNDISHPSTSTSTPSITPSPVDEQAALLAQYRKFWASLTPVDRMPATKRRAALAALAVDPALKSLLRGMANTDAKAQVFYGAHKPRADAASISTDGRTAVVNDCQDSSATGLARRSDDVKLTVGKPRNHVVVTMKKPDERWLVSFVAYSNTPC